MSETGSSAAAVRNQGGTAITGDASGRFGRLCKLMFAVALLPVCLGFAQAFVETFWSFSVKARVGLYGVPENWRWFIFGVLSFTVLGVLVWRPVVVYVLGHELTHALAAWLCFAKVSNLKASAKGGQVSVSKSNTFIRLAPYFIPFFALVTCATFFVLSCFWKPASSYTWVFTFSLGFSMAFHVGFTLWSLRRDQPDLQADGWFFSLVLIFLGNLITLGLVLAFVLKGSVLPAVDLAGTFLSRGLKGSFETYVSVFQSGENLIRSWK